MLNCVHALKSELQEWRYKMDGQVKNYKGELASERDAGERDDGAEERVGGDERAIEATGDDDEG